MEVVHKQMIVFLVMVFAMLVVFILAFSSQINKSFKAEETWPQDKIFDEYEVINIDVGGTKTIKVMKD